MSKTFARVVAPLTLALLASVPFLSGSARAHDYTLGNLKIDHPWTRATPNGAKVAGGFMKITNTGSVPDRLLGGSAEISKIFEIHEMKMEGTMMKMRALEKGLEIKPGETVELKPGSFHVMFIDITRPIKDGESVPGELQFEKAGKLKVDFKASAVGTAAPAAGSHDHGH